jgi:glycerol uptake facilitator-like aquaporin
VLATALFGVPLAVAVFEYAEQAERKELQEVADAIAITVAGLVSTAQNTSVVEPAPDLAGRLGGHGIPSRGRQRHPPHT